MPCGSAPSASRPATTRGSASADGGAFELLKGLDGAKDQSYFLHRLSQAQLARTLFPIGELKKTEVRRLAAEIGLPNAAKKDSTGICFIGERPFREFLNRYLANEPGAIEDERGRTIGEHVGLSFYTLGQRKGIGIGGLKDARGLRGGGEHAPWFVASKDLARNVLQVVAGPRSPVAAVAAGRGRRRELGRRHAAAPRPLRRQDALSPGRRGVRAAPRRRRGTHRARLRGAPVGGDARAVGRPLRRRGLPGRRRHRPLGCPGRRAGATAGPQRATAGRFALSGPTHGMTRATTGAIFRHCPAFPASSCARSVCRSSSLPLH